MGDHSIYTTRVYSPISKIQILIVISFQQMCNKAFGTNIWQNLYVCLYNLDAFQNIFVCVNYPQIKIKIYLKKFMNNWANAYFSLIFNRHSEAGAVL